MGEYALRDRLRRRRLQVGSSIASVLGAMALGTAPATARKACGAIAAGVVTCEPAGNPYADGIAYKAKADFRLQIDPGVLVETSVQPAITLSGDASSIKVGIDPTATIVTHGDDAPGLSISTASGAIDVNAAGSIATDGASSRGIDVYSYSGPVNVVSGTVRTSGDGSTGIHVVGYYGDTSVTSGTVEVTGLRSRGIYVASNGSVSLTSGSVAVTAENESYNAAVFVVAYGAIDVTSGSIVTEGSKTGALQFQALGGDAAIVSDTIVSRGNGGFGIFGEQFYGASSTVQSGSVETSGDDNAGITVVSPDASGTISITSGTVQTNGIGSAGITTRYVEDGTLLTGGDAVTIASGAVTTLGAGADGIVADAAGGPVTVTSGTVATEGAGSRGIVANAPAGPVTIASAGIVTTGDGATGILVNAGGDVAIAGTGDVATLGADAPGLRIATAGSATLDLGSTSSASADAVVVDAANGSSIALAGTTRAGSGVAIRASGGAASIANGGTLTGGVVLGTGDDRFTNTGIFHATVNSDFGAGADSFVNAGRLAGGTGSITFANLENFTNSGTIDLQNGIAGDRLVLPGSFTGSGASRLLVDVGLGGADVLQTGLAGGSTMIGIAVAGMPQLGSAGTLVQAAPGTPASAFTLDTASATRGLVAYALTYDAASGRFGLVGMPGAAAYRTARFAEGVRSTWYRVSDDWSAHMTALRDGLAARTPARSGAWFTLGGGVDRRNGTLGGSFLGVNARYSASYRQDGFSAIGGYDLIAPAATGGFTAGALAAYQTSRLTFSGSADAIRYQSATGGLYAGWSAGGLFAHALGRYQHSWNTIYGRTADYTVKRDGDLYGVTGEVGLRLGRGNLFAEPVATIDWVHTDLDGYTAAGARFRFDADDGLRGKLSVRAGAAFPMRSSTGSVYASAAAVHEFEGRDRVAMTSGGTTAILRGDRIGTYGEGRIGFSVTTSGGITGFFEGFGDASRHYHGWGGRAGLAFHF